jgi:hypothetical protein
MLPKSLIVPSRLVVLFALISLLSVPFARAGDEWAWQMPSSLNWGQINGWEVNGTPTSPQGGPGADDDIITPTSAAINSTTGNFPIVRIHGDQQINNITYDSPLSWTISGDNQAKDRSLIIHGTLTKNGTGMFALQLGQATTTVITANNITMGANGGTLTFGSGLDLNVNGDVAIGAGSTFNLDSSFALQSGKTLSGAGLINANATLSTAGGAIIAPGDGGIGSLTFDGAGNSGAVLDATGASFNFDFAGGNLSDGLAFYNYNAGDLVLGSTLNGTGVTAGTYQLFSFFSDNGLTAATTGDLFDGLSLGTGFDGFDASFDYAGSGISLTLTVSAVPEPATYAALAGALALGFAALRRRRRHSA